jgi:hypothetical protein
MTLLRQMGWPQAVTAITTLLIAIAGGLVAGSFSAGAKTEQIKSLQEWQIRQDNDIRDQRDRLDHWLQQTDLKISEILTETKLVHAELDVHMETSKK